MKSMPNQRNGVRMRTVEEDQELVRKVMECMGVYFSNSDMDGWYPDLEIKIRATYLEGRWWVLLRLYDPDVEQLKSENEIRELAARRHVEYGTPYPGNFDITMFTQPFNGGADPPVLVLRYSGFVEGEAAIFRSVIGYSPDILLDALRGMIYEARERCSP
jgi:hypothetical protein